jgi:F-box protein 21
MQDSLHLDIYICILQQLDVSRNTDDSVKTLVNCSETNSGLRAAAVLSLIWEPHYKARYQYCDADKEAKRSEESNGNRRLMYAQRRRLDRSALLLMDEIVHERIGRGERAKLLVCTYGFDVWDTLELEAQRPVPAPFREEGNCGVGTPQTINRRHWVRKIPGLITKRHAIMLWDRLRNPEGEVSISFEEAISALSGFFGHPVEKV